MSNGLTNLKYVAPPLLGAVKMEFREFAVDGDISSHDIMML